MMRLTRLVVLGTIALALPVQAEVHYKTLTVLHTNDIHGHLFPFEYQGESRGGYDRHSTIFSRLGASAPRVIVMSAGDTWNRGPLEDQKGKPDIATMNAMGYEAWTLGNGEFYAGVPNILDRQKQARFPCLSANVRFRSGAALAKPYVLQTLDGIRVAIVGLSAPRIASYPTTSDLDVKDPYEAARETLKEVRSRADVVIALTHIGYDMDRTLAVEAPGIDLIIGGDSHTRLDHPVLVPRPGPRRPLEIGAVPIAQTQEYGLFVGRTTLYLRSEDGGPWRVVSASGELIPVDSSIPSDPNIRRVLWGYAKPFQKIVGRSTARIPIEREGAFPLPTLVARFAKEAAGADIGVYNINGVQADLPAGELRALGIAYALPFANRLVRASLTKGQIEKLIALEPSVVWGADVKTGAAEQRSLVGATDWQMKTALGTADLPEWKDVGPFRELFEKWLAENSPISP